MFKCSIKTKLTLLAAIALMSFLSYVFLRVHGSSGHLQVHTLYARELYLLVRTIAKSIQLLGLLVGCTSVYAVAKRWKRKEALMCAQVVQVLLVCAVGLASPDAAAQCLPILFGFTL
ncbi:MAG TPA: hypothetical protein V6C76_08595 [Drouetiella sp.]